MSLFASIDRSPYNTITSPSQEGAIDTGNESDSTQKYPMQKIIAAVMRGAAHVQGQSQAKTVAKSQAASNAKMTLTMKPGAPGEPPLVTVKDAPADLLNGTQQSDLIAAHDTPIKQVESKLTPVTESADNAPSAAPIVQPSQDHPLEQAAAAVDAAKGYRLARPWDTDIADKLKSEDGLRAIAEEMGLKDTKAEASRAWKQLQHGVVKPEEVLRRVADFRARKIEEESHALQVTLAPYEEQATAANNEANRVRDDQRAARTQTDAEMKAVYSKWQHAIDETSWIDIPPEQRAQVFDEQNDTGIPATNAVYRQIDRAAQKQALAALKDFRKDKKALGILPDFASAKASFGYDIPHGQMAAFEADWKAARNDYNIQQKNEELKIKAAANQAQRLQITLDRQPDHPTAGAAYDQRLDTLIAAENNGADITKLGVDKNTHDAMVQRRLARIAAGDQGAAFPVALSSAGATAMAKLSGLRTETQGLLSTLDSYLASPEGKKYANVPFSELPAAAKYKMGMASDDEIAKLQSAFSIERYAGTLQLIPGIRRGDIIQKASEHLPIFGKDSIRLMRDKLANADRFYANNEAGLRKFSTKTGVSDGAIGSAPSGPVVSDPAKILEIFKKKP